MYVCMYVCMCVCVYVYVCVCRHLIVVQIILNKHFRILAAALVEFLEP